MGRPKRLYPLGKYRLRTPKESDKNKAYPIELEYTWNRQIIRKTTNVFVKEADWNQNGNQGRGEIRVSYGSEYKRLNQLLLARVERIDSMLAEYNEKHPNQITADIISGFLADKPLTRPDQGKDFVEFTLERLYSEYSRNKIGRSRYENGKSGMNIFQTFLRSTKQKRRKLANGLQKFQAKILQPFLNGVLIVGNVLYRLTEITLDKLITVDRVGFEFLETLNKRVKWGIKVGKYSFPVFSDAGSVQDLEIVKHHLELIILQYTKYEALEFISDNYRQ